MPNLEAQHPARSWCLSVPTRRCWLWPVAVTAFSWGCIVRNEQHPEAAAPPRTLVGDRDWSVKAGPPLASDGAFFTGRYRNVFAEVGKSAEEIQARIDEAFATYFSLTDDNRLYFELTPEEGYVKDIAHDDVRSEGQSYGMMLAVQRGDSPLFDKLWNFALERMRIRDPKHPNYRGYAWAVSPAAEICDENSAPDAEEYFAMSLYFAHHRWGSSEGQGLQSYEFWADEILDMMKNRPEISGPRSRRNVRSDGGACSGARITDQVTSVPLFDRRQKQILFNATKGAEFTDPSYHLPAFYNLFAAWGPTQDAEFWNSAAATSRAFLERAMHEQSGLVTEYANFDGSPHPVSWNNDSGRFAYDSWRVGGNVGMDWAWMMQPGNKLRERADALISHFHAQGPTAYLALWQRDGTDGAGHHSPGLIAMNAVATLATTDSVKDKARAMVEELWNTSLPTGKYRYYDGLLYTFAFLHLSGQYKIYGPSN